MYLAATDASLYLPYDDGRMVHGSVYVGRADGYQFARSDLQVEDLRRSEV